MGNQSIKVKCVWSLRQKLGQSRSNVVKKKESVGFFISMVLSCLCCCHSIVHRNNFFCFFVVFFFYLGFLSQTFTGQQRKGEGIYLTPLYHFHPLHGQLDISRAITAESSPPAHSWQPDSNREPLVSKRKLLNTKLRALEPKRKIF